MAMGNAAAFSLETLKQAWASTGGRCACKRERHGHQNRCDQVLSWGRRGSPHPMGWEPRHRVPPERGGADTAENCEILCWACYAAVPADEGGGDGYATSGDAR